MKRFFVLYIIPFLIRTLIRISYFFSRKEFHGLEEFFTQCSKGPFVVALWHGDLIPVIGFFHSRVVKKWNVYVLVSPSNDGLMLGKVIKGLGGNYETGDSRKGPVSGLIKMIKSIKERSGIPIFAADGPLGPAWVAKPGAVQCAHKCQVPVICVAASAKKAYRIHKSWDKLFIPKLFSKCVYKFSGLFYTSGDIKNDNEKLQVILTTIKSECDNDNG